MTKTIKKCLFAVMVCVLAFATCFSVANIGFASAEVDPTADNNFEKAVEKIAVADYSGKLLDADFYALAYDANAEWHELTAEQREGYEAAVSPSDEYYFYNKYSTMMTTFGDAFAFQELVSSTAEGAEVKFSNFNAFTAVTAEYARLYNLGGDIATWVQYFGATASSTAPAANYGTLNTAWNAFIAKWNKVIDLKDKMDLAIEAIDDLDYATETSVRADWLAYTVKYDVAADVTKIHLPYSERADVGYPINNANSTSIYKKLMAYANSSSLATSMTYDQVKDELAAVKTKVTQDGTLSYYAIAETSLTNDTYSTTYVANYAKALADCEEQDTRIANYVAAVNAIATLPRTNGSLIAAAYPVVTDLVAKLANYAYDANWSTNKTLWWAEEAAAVKATKADSTPYFTGTLYCKDTEGGILYEYSKVWAPIKLAANPVIDAINNIPTTIELTNDVKDKKEDAREKADEFFESVFKDLDKSNITGEDDLKYWVSNYKTLTDDEAAFATQETAVEAWVKAIYAVRATKTKIDVSDFDAIDALQTTYSGFAAIIKGVVGAKDLGTGATEAAQWADKNFKIVSNASNFEVYKNDNDKVTISAAVAEYNNLCDYEAALKADIKAVAALMEKGTLASDKLDTDNYPTDIAGKTKFHQLLAGSTTPAYLGATPEYNKIADDKSSTNYTYDGAQAYLQTNYAADYANYLKALDLDSVFAFEEAVAKFGDKTTAIVNPSQITITDYTDIVNARSIYESNIKNDTKKVNRVNEDIYSTSEESYYDVLVLAEADLKVITDKIDAYIAKVYAIRETVDSSYILVSKQVAFDLVKVQVAKEYYDTLTVAEQTDDVYENETYHSTSAGANALAYDIDTRIQAVKDDFTSRVAAINGKASDYQFDAAQVKEYEALVARYEELNTASRAAAAPLIAVTSQKDTVKADYESMVTACEGRVYNIKAADEALQTAINALDAAYKAADTAEKAAREAQDAVLAGNITAANTALANAKAALEAADAELAAADAAEKIARENADATLAADIDAVETALANAKAALEAADTAEKTARENADAAEAAARKAADDAEKAAREAAIADLQEQLDTVKLIAIIGLVVAAVSLITGAVAVVLIAKKKN